MSVATELKTLGTELPKEMARVRDDLIPQYQSIGPVSNFALVLMRTSLDRATKALAEGDVVEMIAAYKTLKEYKS